VSCYLLTFVQVIPIMPSTDVNSTLQARRRKIHISDIGTDSDNQTDFVNVEHVLTDGRTLYSLHRSCLVHTVTVDSFANERWFSYYHVMGALKITDLKLHDMKITIKWVCNWRCKSGDDHKLSPCALRIPQVEYRTKLWFTHLKSLLLHHLCWS